MATHQHIAHQRIVVPSLGPGSWRALLADPKLHWRRGKSAWELAVAWEACALLASGLPPEVESALASESSFANATLLHAVPEHCVILDDPRRPSQNDLWALLSAAGGYVSMTIEAKAGEDFDKPISKWLASESEGKRQRLAFLQEVLELSGSLPPETRYQLVHRTASAVLEARRWGAKRAIMLVQSFAESKTSWQDYSLFAQLFGAEAARGKLVRCAHPADVELYLGWVDCHHASDSLAALSLGGPMLA